MEQSRVVFSSSSVPVSQHFQRRPNTGLNRRHAYVELQGAKLEQRFERAMEEACELRDRRAGKTPATSHEPLDFRTETVVYDPMVVPDADFSFTDLFPQLTAAEVAAFDPARATALLRAACRDPTVVCMPQLGGAAPPESEAAVEAMAQYGELKVAERMAAWCRFYKAPRAVQRQMCKQAMGAPLLLRCTPRGLCSNTRLLRCACVDEVGVCGHVMYRACTVHPQRHRQWGAVMRVHVARCTRRSVLMRGVDAVAPVSKRRALSEGQPGAVAHSDGERVRKRPRAKSDGGSAVKDAKVNGQQRRSKPGRLPKHKGGEKGLSAAAAKAAMRAADDGSESSGEEDGAGGKRVAKAGRRSDASGAAGAGGGSSAQSEGVHLSADNRGDGAGGDSADEDVPLKKRAAFAAVQLATQQARSSGTGRGRGRGRGRGGAGRGSRVQAVKAEVKAEVKSEVQEEEGEDHDSQLALWAQGLNQEVWPAELPVEVVSSEADLVMMIPRRLPTHDRLECGPLCVLGNKFGSFELLCLCCVWELMCILGRDGCVCVTHLCPSASPLCRCRTGPGRIRNA